MSQTQLGQKMTSLKKFKIIQSYKEASLPDVRTPATNLWLMLAAVGYICCIVGDEGANFWQERTMHKG